MKYNDITLGKVEAIINMLGGMEGVQQLLSGNMELKVINHIIDCDKAPLIPYDSWKVEEHIKGGQFTWNPEKVKLFLSVNQKDGKSIEGNKLRKELKDEPVMNANLLDYLLIIRTSFLRNGKWTRKATPDIFSSGVLSTAALVTASAFAFLYFSGGRWKQDYCWFGYGFDGNHPACVSAK